jgi:hypothetical protein
MPETKQNTISIPESVTIKGVTYLVSETPELQTFIQAVSKVEKSKLYSQFESLKAQMKELGNVQVTENKPLDTDSLVNALKEHFVTKEDLTTSLKSTVEEVVRPVLDATKKTQEDELKAYREKLITENAATCIPDLVKGNTKEELDAALAESIRMRAAYPPPGSQPPYSGDPNIQKTAQQEGFQAETPLTPTPETPKVPAAPAVPHRPAPDASREPEGVKQMSIEEFAKKRDSLKSQLESLYGGGTL